MPTNDEGIEIHWDERDRHLSLACGAEAFERFRKVVREEIGDFPETPVDQAITIEISDTRRMVARQKSSEWTAIAIVVAITLIGAGAAALALW